MSRTRGNLWSVDFANCVPYVGIGDLTPMHLQPHEFLFGRVTGIEANQVAPWSEEKDCETTLVTLTRNDVPYAVMSIEGDYKLKHEGNELASSIYTVSMTENGLGAFTVDADISLTPKQLAEELGQDKYKFEFQGYPAIFSTVPLAINYTTITEGALNENPALVGDRLLMDGRLSKISNGVANIPAGTVTELGPLLNSVINCYEKDTYMVTRRLTMSIRMLSYGG